MFRTFRNVFVYLGIVQGHLLALPPGPDHEGVHWPLDVVLLSSG